MKNIFLASTSNSNNDDDLHNLNESATEQIEAIAVK